MTEQYNKSGENLWGVSLSMLGVLVGTVINWSTADNILEFIILPSILGGIGLLVGSAINAETRKKAFKQDMELGRLEYKKQQDWIKSIFKQHAEKLVRKRKQLVTANDYGKFDYKAWKKEVETFFNSAVRTLPGTQVRMPPNDIYVYIDSLVLEHEKKAIKHGIEPFDETMSGIDYEHYCADLLKNLGWIARVTQSTGDQGVDIVASKSDYTIAVQCKKYGKPVGNKAVQEAYAGMGFVGADMAVVMSNNTFTPAAKQLAQTLGVELIHHTELILLDSKTKQN